MNIWTALCLFTVYLAGSCWLFVHTSGGWNTFSLLFTAPIIASVIFLVALARTTHAWGADKTALSFGKRGRMTLLLLAAAQCFAVLTNYTDCGEGSGGMIFLQQVLGAACGDGRLYLPWITAGESLAARCLYAVVLTAAVLSMEAKHGKVIDTSLPNPTRE